jgi:type IV secretory pathway VirB9-like protein
MTKQSGRDIGRKERPGKGEACNRFGAQFPSRVMALSEAGREAERGSLDGVCSASATRSHAKKVVIGVMATGLIFGAEPSLQTRVVTVHKEDIVPLYALHNYSTMVEIPRQEEIINVSCGDKDSWKINYGMNVAFIKPDPKRSGLATNINILAKSGNTYSFTVREVSTDKAQQADLKVIIDQGEPDGIVAISYPAYVRASELDDLKKTVEKQKEELAQTKHSAVISEVKAISHDYEWKHGKEADVFGLKAIYHDDKFTYIEATSQNAPALYQILDGKESVVQYELQNGRYVVPVVLDKAVLRAGKTKLEFERKG